MQERSFEKAISSLDEVFAFLHRFVEEEGLAADLQFSLDFVVEEIFTNMVKHNTGSTNDIVIGVGRDDRRVHVQLTDFDVDPFDPEKVEEYDVGAPLEKRRPGGLGLHLVKAMADKITFEYDARTLRVSIFKNLTPKPRG
jgi:anti-sigma regulatory factor (Ser/Thr protein kinase)